MADSSDTYRVGLASCDVTPPVGIKLAGYAARDEPSTAVYHSLRGTAMALDDGTDAVLLVSVEWLGFYDRTAQMRRFLQQVTGLGEDHILLVGTHTHCGPAVRAQDAERHGPLDVDYLDQAEERLTACGAEAWNSRSPAVLRWATGTCDLAASRRKPDGQGGVLWQPSLEAPHDHEVPVLVIESPLGDVRGVLFSYACHPTSRAGTLIGGDWVAFACDRVESLHPGALAIFLQGCAGDQKINAADAAGRFRALEVPEIQDCGERLGDAVQAAVVAASPARLSGPLTVAGEAITLETEPTDPARVAEALESPHEYARAWARHLLDREESGVPVSRDVPFEVQTLRLGESLAVVAWAAEMTVEHGLRLKRELAGRFDHVLPLGYANDIIGYVPVRRQIPEGGYEVWTANQYHKRTGPYVAETEDRIHAATHRLLGLG